MKILLPVLLLTLGGCALPGVSDLPSVQYCEKVDYSRTGDVMELTAKCRVR
jgi:hypothetical protein